MKIEVSEEPLTSLGEYARIPMAFEVSRMIEIEEHGNGGFQFLERRLDAPYVKDYDAMEREGPARWAQSFDLSNWALFAARVSGRQVGGAAVAFKTPALYMLEGRDDLAVLWDIRVSPEARGQGIGSALFRAAEDWAAAKGCKQLKIETQNINVPACRFYESRGCKIGAIHRSVYPDCPEEIQLLWYKDIFPWSVS